MDEKEVEELRKMKDRFFRSENSPLGQNEKAGFKGLKYFPYDPQYNVSARFMPYTAPVMVSMDTSRGIKQVFMRAGYLEFSVKGKEAGLQAYVSSRGAHSEGYFVPFKDQR